MSSKPTPSIQVQNVSKQYRLGRGLIPLFSFRRKPTTQSHYWALKDLNFTLDPGQSLGIIGPNGAGKTTTLKILSHVTHPTQGTLHTNGRLSALIELGAGFHPDLTGRENIFLNGTILGMSQIDIRQRFDQIVDFAGIGQYLDTPVKRYSSGMYARLGFAIAAHVDPQILLVDEVLAVGDFAFQMKCHARMDQLRANGTSLIFVSHNFEAIRRVCDRGLVLYQGNTIYNGTAADAIVAYSNAIRQAAHDAQQTAPTEAGLSQRVMTFDAEISQVQLLDHAGNPTTTFPTNSQATVAIDIKINQDIAHPIFACTIRHPNGQTIYDTTTHWQNIPTPHYTAGTTHRLTFTFTVHLLDGLYELGVDIAAPDLSHYYDRLERALTFQVTSPQHAKGLVDLHAQINFA